MDTIGKYTGADKMVRMYKNNSEPIIFGDGSTSMDLIHVKDVAYTSILAMEKYNR